MNAELQKSIEYIQYRPDRAIRRATPRQLHRMAELERELGYKSLSHRNMPAYKAIKYIDRLTERLELRRAANEDQLAIPFVLGL